MSASGCSRSDLELDKPGVATASQVALSGNVGDTETGRGAVNLDVAFAGEVEYHLVAAGEVAFTLNWFCHPDVDHLALAHRVDVLDPGDLVL